MPGEDPNNGARLISLWLRTLPVRGRSLPAEMPPRITVVGSLNTDLVIRAPHLPSVGETVTGGEFATFPGGKGANQAVAAARLGARVAMVGCVGGDDFGRRLADGQGRRASRAPTATWWRAMLWEALEHRPRLSGLG